MRASSCRAVVAVSVVSSSASAVTGWLRVYFRAARQTPDVLPQAARNVRRHARVE